MKKLFTVIAIALFSISISAQETKPASKAPAKKEACCAKKDAKKCTAEGKICTAQEKAKCEKTSKSCCAKK